MKIVLKIILLFAFFGCNKSENKVSWDPYYPNYGMTLEKAEKMGFKVSSLDHGSCIYDKSKDTKTLLSFNGEFKDECKVFISQEIYISLWDSLKFESNITETGRELTEKDSTEIIQVLKTYNSNKITNFKKVAPCRSVFQATNNKGEIIEWSIALCDRDLILSTYAELRK